MALFGIKKSSEEGGSDGPLQFSPEKARKFFDHAKTVDEATNYEYAVQSWLQGLKMDPASVEGVAGFFGSLARFLGESGGKKLSKDVFGVVAGKTSVDRYLQALLEWGQKNDDAVLAVRAFESAAKIGLIDPAKWIGDRALNWVARDKKPRKDLFVRLSENFERIGSFDKAVAAAEAATKLDPTDGQLAARLRSLAAQATMTRGGYERAGEAGGFRANVRDLGKQRQLEESERIVKTEETIDRLVATSEEEYAKRPADLPTIETYAKRLIERARGNDEDRAHEILTKAYADTNQFRFREMAGDVRLRQARRRISESKQALEADPADPAKIEAHQQAMKAYSDLEIAELALRVQNYPTDLSKKYSLGRSYLAAHRYEDAIPLFQESQGDPRYRAGSMGMLAECFRRMEWSTEAIETYRAALEVRELMPEQQMDLQYGLMLSLKGKAESERDLPAAEEAEKIASSIAIKNIAFRDIRKHREELKKLVQSLKGPGPAAS